MYLHSSNKLIAASSALAAAGVLTCVAAFLEAFMPKGSLAAFLASMTLLGLVVMAVLIGYTWACDRYESYFQGRLARLISIGKADRNVAFGPRTVTRSPRLEVNIPLEKEQNLWT